MRRHLTVILVSLAIVAVARAQTTILPEVLRMQDVDCHVEEGNRTVFWVGPVSDEINCRAWLFFPTAQIPDEYASASLTLSHGGFAQHTAAELSLLLWEDTSLSMGYEFPRCGRTVHVGRIEMPLDREEDYPTHRFDITAGLESLRPFDRDYLVLVLWSPICQEPVTGVFRGMATDNPDDRPSLHFEQPIPAERQSLGGVKGRFR